MNKAKILVVDDDPKLSRLIRLVLEGSRLYTVTEVNRPNDALRVAHEFQPDAILMDVDMPGKDGGEVAREFAADAALNGVPLIFVTSLVTGVVSESEAVVRGGRLFLSKPVNTTVLLRTLESLLAGGARA